MNINLGMVLVILSNLCAKNQVLILLYVSQISSSKIRNQGILKNVISCLKATTRFDRQLIDF